MNIPEFHNRALILKKQNQAFYGRLKIKTPKNLDELFYNTHEEVFESTDCLTCANCCKTTSPIFYQRDVERASKNLRMKPGKFIENYLRVDEEGDLVLKSSPCFFLAADNTCNIYKDRPAACREYPHTNRKKIKQILDLTFRNTLVCPAVLRITEKIRLQLEG